MVAPSKNTRIIAIIVITFLIMFATSFLADLEIINRSWIRMTLIVLLIIIEGFIGFLIFKNEILTGSGKKT